MARMIFLSMALFTAFTDRRVRAAASVGVNRGGSWVCIVHHNRLRLENILSSNCKDQVERNLATESMDGTDLSRLCDQVRF